YVDLYYAHYDDEGRPIEEIAPAFDRLVRDGKVRYVAISNFEPSRSEEWIRFARENGLAVPVALQPEYNLVARRNYEATVAPLADLEGRRRGGSVAECLHDEGRRVIGALGTVAAAREAASGPVGLAWLLAKATVTAPLAGATRVGQLAELMAAPGLELTADEV